MGSIILSSVTRFMMPLLLMVSVFLLIRGHDLPGGGFIAGLMAACAFSLYALAFGIEQVVAVLHIQPGILLGVGILISTASGIISLFTETPFMTGKWLDLDLPIFGPTQLGTPMIFDIGVYFVVFGMVTSIIVGLAEE